MPRARRFFQRGLDPDGHTGDDWSLTLSLSGLAGLCAQTGELERAARLFGAEARLRQRIQADLLPAIAADHRQSLEHVQRQLDLATFTAAWQEGYAMTKEQAISYAREGLPGDTPATRTLPADYADHAEWHGP